MNRNLLRLALPLIALVPMIASAQTGGAGRKDASDIAASSTGSAREQEDYYFQFGLGVPINNYPEDTKAAIDELKGRNDLNRYPFDGQLGVYWSLGDTKTIAGVTFEATSDIFLRGEDQSLSFEIYQLAGSIQYFPMSGVGDGLYGRADVGMATASIKKTYYDLESRASGNIGLALRGSVGYAIPLSSGTSLAFDAGVTFRQLPGYTTGEAKPGDIFEKGSYTSGVFSASVLW